MQSQLQKYLNQRCLSLRLQSLCEDSGSSFKSSECTDNLILCCCLSYPCILNVADKLKCTCWFLYDCCSNNMLYVTCASAMNYIICVSLSLNYLGYISKLCQCSTVGPLLPLTLAKPYLRCCNANLCEDYNG